jgi:hypothetical protein
MTKSHGQAGELRRGTDERARGSLGEGDAAAGVDRFAGGMHGDDVRPRVDLVEVEVGLVARPTQAVGSDKGSGMEHSSLGIATGGTPHVYFDILEGGRRLDGEVKVFVAVSDPHAHGIGGGTGRNMAGAVEGEGNVLELYAQGQVKTDLVGLTVTLAVVWFGLGLACEVAEDDNRGEGYGQALDGPGVVP